MSATGIITISGSVVSSVGGNKIIAPPQIKNLTGCIETLTPVLAAGDNTIAIPTNALAVVVTPPAGNLIAVKLKGAAGDTGINLSLTLPLEIPFPVPPPASFILNAASLFTAQTEISFV